MNITQLYEDYNIHYAGEQDRHYRAGWINTVCPYCSGNPGYHLGFNLSGNYYYCWRCGYHFTTPTIAKLIGTSEHDAHQIVRSYNITRTQTIKQPKVRIRRKSFRYPSNSCELTDRHKQYLERRGFDSERLIRKWNLLGTGPVSRLDNIDFKQRIVIPIKWYDNVVSFQTRDITNKHLKKYLTCPKDRELVFHKDILYGNQQAWNNVGICVEGITDVWRLGMQAFATFGIEYTHAQLQFIAKHFKRVVVVFDPDPQAVKQARKLVADLQFRNVDAKYITEFAIDPASMKQDDADYFVKQILSFHKTKSK